MPREASPHITEMQTGAAVFSAAAAAVDGASAAALADA